MKYFTINEFIRSDEANKRNIDNTPTEYQRNNDHSGPDPSHRHKAYPPLQINSQKELIDKFVVKLTKCDELWYCFFRNPSNEEELYCEVYRNCEKSRRAGSNCPAH